MNIERFVKGFTWFLLEVIGLFLVLILWGVFIRHSYLLILVILSIAGYVLWFKKLAEVYPSFAVRLVTSTVLLVMLIGSFYYLSSDGLAMVILALYGYAFFIEFVSLAQHGFKQSPKITVCAGTALMFTGIMHAFWVYDPATHLYLFLCIGAAVLSDTGGYIVGTLCGKHLLAPAISPKKTWEGLAGSIVLTVFCGLLLAQWYMPAISPLMVTLLSVFLAIAALFGDLLFSALKRAAGAKDSGTLLPGHGGLIDRLDSIVGTTIVLFIIILLLQLLYQIDLFY